MSIGEWVRMDRFRVRRGDDRGASLVELAFTLPLLLILLFGIIEASWAFSQQNNIRHGAREGARLAAVDFGDVSTLGQEVCDRMDVIAGSQPPTVALTPIGASSVIGGQAQIQVSANVKTITGFMDAWFAGRTVSSTIEFRLEQPLSGEPAWWNGGSGGSYSC